ncbi:MAG: hypothetical protein MJ092_06000 [Lachnospiraceae bacterium]|nr:hypothetical protein [Lachnospiraceae bacterium]
MALLLAGTFGGMLDNVLSGFDWSIFSFFGGIQSGFLNFLAKIFTGMGSPIYGVLFGVLGLVLCLFRRTRRVGFALVQFLRISVLNLWH